MKQLISKVNDFLSKYLGDLNYSPFLYQINVDYEDLEQYFKDCYEIEEGKKGHTIFTYLDAVNWYSKAHEIYNKLRIEEAPYSRAPALNCYFDDSESIFLNQNKELSIRNSRKF